MSDSSRALQTEQHRRRLVAPASRRAVARLGLLDDVEASLREVAIAAIALGVLAAAVFGPHVAHGGFVHDDWAYSALSRFASSFGDAVARNRASTGNRVLNAVYLAALHRTLGLHVHAVLAWITALAVAMSVSVYAVARLIRVERLHAFAIAALTLLAPSTDANRLWVTAGGAQLSLALAFGGIAVALAGLSQRGRRAVLVHAVALAMYVASLLVYEAPAALIALAFLLYRLRSSWRASLVRWAFDVVAVLATLIYVRSNAAQHVQDLHGQIRHARIIQAQARLLVEWLGIPESSARIPAVLIAALLALALVLWYQLPRGRDKQELGRWLCGICAGVLLVAVGYVMFVPADLYYSPLSVGMANRTNVLAVVGYAVFLYSFAMVLCTGLFRGLPSSSQWAAAAALALSVFLAVAYVHRLRTDAAAYDRSWALQEQILDAVKRDVPAPAHGSAVYLFRSPADAAPGIPVFGASWDLTGALRTMWDDETVRGIPSTTVTEVQCLDGGVHPVGFLYAPNDLTDYRHSIFVDATSGRYADIRGPDECRRAKRLFQAPA